MFEEDRVAGQYVDPRVAVAIIDVFAYVVVLNLFVQFFPEVISETFVLSILTALLLKVVLEVVLVAKKWAAGRLRRAKSAAARAAAAVLVWAVLFGSKFLVLETVDLAFGERVSLGGFVSVSLLIVTLMVARAGVRRLLLSPSAALRRAA